MASSSPGASPSSNWNAWLRAVLAKRRPAAASRPSFPSRKNCVTPRRKSTVRDRSKKPADRLQRSPPSSAAKRRDDRVAIFPVPWAWNESEGTTAMTTVSTFNRARVIVAALVIILGAYWAGTRFGSHGPTNVEAVPPSAGGSGALYNVAARDAALTEDESINVRIYRQASPAVANFHVVEGAQSIEVVLGDQSHHPAKYIGADQRNDVALIKIDPKGKHLSALPLGDSGAIQVGQKVLAIGDPFGFQSTLTTGVVSALGRTVQTSQTTFIDEAIQTDAAINRGNSGGPLINTHGEVIGINSAIYTPSGTTAGIGFAIPINTAKNIANDLITDGRVHRAFLGVETLSVNDWLGEALDLPVKEGLLVERATKGGPAAAAGIHGGDRVAAAGMRKIAIGGDVIVAIDSQKVAGQFDVNVLLNRKRPGDTVTVTLYRGGKKMDNHVKLSERK